MLNPFITLSPAETRLARELARVRYTADRRIGAVDLLAGDYSRKQAFEENGAAAEISFSKWFGIPFDSSAELIPGAPDFTIHGVRIDVKSSERRGNLLIPMECKRGRAQVYVYVSGSLATKARFELIGWTTETIAFQDRYLRNLGRGFCRVIPPSDLYPMSKLPRALKQFSRVPTGSPSPIYQTQTR